MTFEYYTDSLKKASQLVVNLFFSDRSQAINGVLHSFENRYIEIERVFA
jgi:hypothetical protein